MSNKLQVINDAIMQQESRFNSVLADPSISFKREAGFAYQVISQNSFAASTAMNNMQSLVDAVTNIAAIGISLNPAQKLAYLVPRDKKICLDISYMGLVQIALDSGSILWAKCEVVYEGEQFELSGVDQPPVHKRDPFSKDRKNENIRGVYVVVKTNHGDYLTDCMSKDEIDAIMKRSTAYKSGKPCPWRTDYTEMAKKTVIKRAYKMWPKTDRLATAIDVLNRESDEGIEFSGEQTYIADYLTPIYDALSSHGKTAESFELVTKRSIANIAQENVPTVLNWIEVNHDKLG